jgi:hypothetical protein
MQTIVTRPPGDKQGPDISDALLTTVDSQIERGRAEINQNCSSRMQINGNCTISNLVAPGSTVQVTDMENGVYYAVVDSWALNMSINGNQLDASTSIVLERE